MKQIALFLLMTIVFVGAYAQKLPNKQERGLRAPANVKIDGKATEWGAELQAYNNATELFYTLANDDENLYLAVQTKTKAIVEKLFNGGISLCFDNIRNPGKATRAVVTYSAISRADKKVVDKARYDTTANKITLVNKAIAAAVKTIAVKNFDGIANDVVSVYNEYGITAASYLSDNNTYTCELAIPLKNLKSFIDNKSVLHYTLQSNAMPVNSLSMNINGVPVEDITASAVAMENVNMMLQGNYMYAGSIRIRDLMTDTNVSGEYTLAK